ncbi:MAG: hypothetical protein J5781_00285, partial [Clostridia bacterium]|nr:hypothetical protein [Clostridia bacterium]
MGWFKRVTNAVSNAVHDVGHAVSSTVKNVEKQGKNLVENPLGTVGAFVTNPLGAQAALTTNKTAAALEEYENTNFAKAVGAATIATGAVVGATEGIAALSAESVPLAAT